MSILSPAFLAPAVAAIVAGFVSYLAGRGMRSHDWRLSLAREHMLERRQVYGRFLTEADRLMLLRADGSKGQLPDLERLFAENSVLSLVASTEVVEQAKLMCACVLNAFAKDPDTSKPYSDVKDAFIRAAKSELLTLEDSVGMARRSIWKRGGAAAISW